MQLRRILPASLGTAAAVSATKFWRSCLAEESTDRDVRITEEEVRRHNQPRDAWISFNGSVYDITGYIEKHPPCEGLDWATRLAGRRFEHFLGRDAFGPAHLGCGADGKCSRGIKVAGWCFSFIFLKPTLLRERRPN